MFDDQDWTFDEADLTLFDDNSSIVHDEGQNSKTTELFGPSVTSVSHADDQDTRVKHKRKVTFAVESADSRAAKRLCREVTNLSQGAEMIAVSPAREAAKVPRPKRVVVRKFPGPAGIFPDDKVENDAAAAGADLDSPHESEHFKRSLYAGICSQNTMNMFLTGAWQMMMDDLPADLQLTEMQTIHEKAAEYNRNYTKIPYVAGTVKDVILRQTDPTVVLQDPSGHINASVHHDVLRVNPNALQIGVVLLAKDVGLYVTSKKYVSLVISLDSIVGIYTNEKRLFASTHLKSLVQNNELLKQIRLESQIRMDDDEGRLVETDSIPDELFMQNRQLSQITVDANEGRLVETDQMQDELFRQLSQISVDDDREELCEADRVQDNISLFSHRQFEISRQDGLDDEDMNN